MKNFRIIATAAVAVLAIAANAQVKGRSFSYTSKNSIDADYSGAGDVDLKARTTVKVNPYLYIVGNLGAEWTVDGWGTGVDTKTESLRFFHNETLTLDCEKFANPAKISGTKTGRQSVQLEGKLSFFNDTTGKNIWNGEMEDISDLNEIFNPSGPHFGVNYSGGLLRMDFSRKITISPEVGPGVYENVGYIKVIRN